MIQEDKELLLKDICGRMPYGVKVQIIYPTVAGVTTLDVSHIEKLKNNERYVVKPYLRPMSNMTEEEKEQIRDLWIDADTNTHATRLIDFYNKNHFDYRGLIDKGLAIEVTEENNPYKDKSYDSTRVVRIDIRNRLFLSYYIYRTNIFGLVA